MPPAERHSIARNILHDLLTLPTAPFAEHYIIGYIARFCADRPQLKLKRDEASNLLVRLRIGSGSVPRPVCLTAHMDHPGFVADRMIGRGKLRAFWRGGVPPEYFPGAKVRFFVDGSWVRGRISDVRTVRYEGHPRVYSVTAQMPGEVPRASVGMWDFPDPKVRKGKIHARGCDDVAGVAAILSSIDELVRSQQPCDAYYLFTRAEEVGFVGAIAAARAQTVPRRCIVITMETSAERINARQGDGPILRVGDKATAFTPSASAHVQRIATELATRDKSFRWQRKLMDGGTCESSVFANMGYDATGMCVALGNYHNVDAKAKRLAPEYIDLADYDNVVKWFVELARTRVPYRGRDEVFLGRLERLRTTYQPLLYKSVEAPA